MALKTMFTWLTVCITIFQFAWITGNYTACSVCHCSRKYHWILTCKTTLLDPHMLFNFTNVPDSITQLLIKSNTDKSRSYLPETVGDQPLFIPQYAFVSLKNVDTMNFQTTYILAINKLPFTGINLAGFYVENSRFQELSFEALQEVSTTLQFISIFELDIDTSERQLLSLRSFPKLQQVLITKVPTVKVQVHAYNLSILHILQLSNIPNLYIPEGSFERLPELNEMDLTDNSLQEVPPDIRDLTSLQILHLGHNMIFDIEDFDFLTRLSMLRELRLYGNYITMVSAKAVANLKRLTELSILYMGDNAYNCTCELMPFAIWLRDTYVDVGLQWHFPRNGNPYKSSDFDGNEPSYKCAFPPELLGAPLLTLVTKNCTPPSTTTNSSNHDNGNDSRNTEFWNPMIIGIVASVITVISFLTIAGVIFAIVMCRKIARRHVGIFPRVDDDEEDLNDIDRDMQGFRYDAYISHHDNLDEFVAHNFLPRLEQGPNNLRLCLSFRDFIIGADKLDNITNAFETSRTTIFLIDQDFVNSNQCMLELKISCSYLLDDDRPANVKQDGLILILLDAIPRDLMPTTLRVLMNKITYLEWDKLDDERCWRQLEASLHLMKADAI